MTNGEMSVNELENLVYDIKNWSINRFSKLTKKNQMENAIALEEEFSEWLMADLKTDEIEIFTLN